jgi:chemotaxis protein methyltransferase CheR
MHSHELRYLSEMIKRNAGIDLKEDKRYLFEARLLPIASRLGYADLSAFVNYLIQSPPSPSSALLQEIIEAMTTNESMFFRDTKPFTYLKEVMFPELLAKNPSKAINIWCAACSTGQEPYSISIVCEEMRPQQSVHIMATDIDNQVIQKAKAGNYNQFEVQRGLSSPHLLKYFSQNGTNWCANDSIKQKISFAQHNLMEDPRRLSKMFDIVFCRYVLIYFDDATKVKVLQHIASVIPTGGYLMLGGAETLPAGVTQFTPHHKERQIFVRV